MKIFKFKAIDFRSVLIGLLGGLLIAMLAGATSGVKDLTCKSLTIVDDSGTALVTLSGSKEGGTIITRNTKNTITSFLGTNVDMDGQLRVKNKGGYSVVLLGTDSSGRGFVDVFDASDKRLLAIENGFVQTFNDYGKATVYIGTSSSNSGILKMYNSGEVMNSMLGTIEGGDGQVQVYDKTGTLLFSK